MCQLEAGVEPNYFSSTQGLGMIRGRARGQGRLQNIRILTPFFPLVCHYVIDHLSQKALLGYLQIYEFSFKLFSILLLRPLLLVLLPRVSFLFDLVMGEDAGLSQSHRQLFLHILVGGLGDSQGRKTGLNDDLGDDIFFNGGDGVGLEDLDFLVHEGVGGGADGTGGNFHIV